MSSSTTPPKAARNGPTICFRGLANATYYILQRSDKATYADYTGCGNTLNANEPVVHRMIIDCMRHWVRRDARRRLPVRPRRQFCRANEQGRPMPSPPLIWDIETQPVLARRQTDRGSVGRQRSLPGRQFFSGTP